MTMPEMIENRLSGFHRRWLRACAVYPMLRWPLTVLLGCELAALERRDPPDIGDHAVLARLEWFRYGRIPAEERQRLIEGMSAHERNAVREIYAKALETSARDRSAPAGPEPIDDPLFAQFMLSETPSPRERSMNAVLERYRGPQSLSWLDARVVLAILLALLGAVGTASIAYLATADWEVEGPVVRTIPIPRMVVLPGGTFEMGSPEDEEGRDPDEGPVRWVTIAPFEIAQTEVTVGQYRAFIEESGHQPDPGCWVWDSGRAEWVEQADRSWETPGFPQTERHPVVCVSWNDAQAYIAWLNRAVEGGGFRLPSEAEWEYAARAASTGRYFWSAFVEDDGGSACGYANGFDISARQSGSFMIQGTFNNCDDGYVFTAPIAGRLPNAFALFDMAGNVFEWVEDCWHDSYEGAPSDGRAWLSDQVGDCGQRVLRGGSWDDDPRFLRSANRGRVDPENRNGLIGFRPARTLTP